MLAKVAAVGKDLPQHVDGFVQVTEHQEHLYKEEDAENGNLEFALAQEGLLEDGQVQVPEFEHAQGPIGADGQGAQGHQGNDDLTDEVVEPAGTEKQFFLVLSGYVGDFGVVGLHTLVQPFLLVQEQQFPDRGNRQDQGQLEVPPYQDDEGHEDVTHQTDNDGNGRNGEGNPANDGVCPVCLSAALQVGDELPQRHPQEQGREEQVHEGIGHKQHSATDDKQGRENSGQVYPDTAGELGGFQPDEEGRIDGHQQAQERVHDADGLARGVVFDALVAKDKEHDTAQQQRQVALLLFGHPLFQRLDEFVRRPHHQGGQAPQEEEDQDIHDEPVNSGRIDEPGIIGNLLVGIVGFLAGQRLPDVGETVFLAHVPADLFPVSSGLGENGEPGSLPLYEYFVFNDIIVFPGVVIGFFHPQAGFPVMGAVRHHQFPRLGIHFQELRCVQHAGVAVRLANLAQDKRRRTGLASNGVLLHGGVQGHNVFHLLVQVLLQEALVLQQMHIQGVVVVGQAVRHHFYVQKLRRKTAQGLDEARIAVNLHIQGEHNAVVRGAVLVEVFVLTAYLLQRITDVKGVFLFLGVQHQGQVVALFDDVHHLLVLNLVGFPLLFPGAVYPLVFVIQFTAEVGQGGVQAHSGKYGQGGDGDGKQQDERAKEFPFLHVLDN